MCQVNIIPIIAKADTINKNELAKFKAKIMNELRANGVSIYQFPVEDETVSEVNKEMNSHLPFAVVGSNEFVKVGTKNVRARQYPWGVVQVENENHCDFKHLREMLIRTNMEDLRDQTQLKHYELYRKDRLKQMGFSESESNGSTTSFAETYTLRHGCIKIRIPPPPPPGGGTPPPPRGGEPPPPPPPRWANNPSRGGRTTPQRRAHNPPDSDDELH